MNLIRAWVSFADITPYSEVAAEAIKKKYERNQKLMKGLSEMMFCIEQVKIKLKPIQQSRYTRSQAQTTPTSTTKSNTSRSHQTLSHDKNTRKKKSLSQNMKIAVKKNASDSTQRVLRSTTRMIHPEKYDLRDRKKKSE